MIELVQDNWILFGIALIVGLLVAWWLFVASRRTKVEIERKEEGEPGPAKRNQALIDAPPAAAPSPMAMPPATPAGMAGVGEAMAAAVTTAPPPVGLESGEATPAAAAAPAPADLPADRPVDRAPDRAANRATDRAADTPEDALAEPEPEQVPPAPAPAAQSDLPTMATPAPGVAPAAGDELLRIKGLGPKLADQLHALGITSLAQIAAWDEGDIDRIDAQLGRFQGRIRRDDWPLQARLLTAGDTAAYEARFGRI